VGKAHAEILPANLEAIQVNLMRNGELVEQGSGANVLGSPLRSLHYLVRLLHSQAWAAPIRPGEIITTGTLTAARSLVPGEEWLGKVDNMALKGFRVCCC
jgi:2-keto-4-pentenoate hydratase